jgi:hypothetical protein
VWGRVKQGRDRWECELGVAIHDPKPHTRAQAARHASTPTPTYPFPPAVSTPTVLSGFWSVFTPQIMVAASYCASARVGM